MNPTFSRHLRTKKMYTGSTAEELFAEEDANENASPCHFWCNLTQALTGPDDRSASKATCKPPRSCFEE